MKIIGLLGGMSWESTAEYYRLINETVKERRGGLHSAKILLYSVDFEEIEQLQHAGRWNEATDIMIDGAQRVERGGADFLLLCTNTMHKMAAEVQDAIDIPLLHIADATAEEIKRVGIQKVGLLGTRFTMEQAFYRGRLASHGLEVVIPDEEGRRIVHDVIYNQLCLGKIVAESRDKYLSIMSGLEAQQVGGIILGCTEISLLVKPEDVRYPLFDTTAIHARKAVERALA